MKVVALQTWSNGTITMEEKSVADIPDALAEQLIADGICADASEYFGGGGVFEVTFTPGGADSCNKTFEQIEAARASGKTIILRDSRAGSNFIYCPLNYSYLPSFSGFGYQGLAISIDLSGEVIVAKCQITSANVVTVDEHVFQLTAAT